tara:strand:- start:523 stop:822 length:300 start_codon:yes stop_codon:yes gene_type:complete
MFTITEKTTVGDLVEALPLVKVEIAANIIGEAIETMNSDFKTKWTAEQVSNLTIQEFEYFLLDLTDDLNVDFEDENEMRYEAFVGLIENFEGAMLDLRT